MPEEFEPLLFTTDWNDEWIELQKARKRYDDESAWDERAKTYPVKHGSHEGYAARFIELAGIKPKETVLDMGCGTGSLATPLALLGYDVVACDFSRGMLDVMEADQRSLGIDTVRTMKLSWADDWHAHGIGSNSVDVAIASRSIATNDLLDSLMKLNDVARRRVCITLPCSSSPRADDRLLKAAGFASGIGRDFAYAFNILIQHGLRPEVAYIPNERVERFESREDALGKFSEIVTNAVRAHASDEELARVPARLDRWLDGNLVERDGAFELAKPREVVWAFLAWEPR